MTTSTLSSTSLNGITPYFTMFPLSFPYGILETHSTPSQSVLDPFCGRGTTNLAARLHGLNTVGIDSSPVAIAIAQAKLVSTSEGSIRRCAERILDEVSLAMDVPTGPFWELAYHSDVLSTLCRLREGLLRNCDSDVRKALRAIVMGALHGPRTKSQPSYFSNQCQRTYAPKPAYAVRYWQKNELVPLPVNVLDLISRRASRYYDPMIPIVAAKAVLGDSTQPSTFRRIGQAQMFDWVITSPPYYGMRTYIPDQWLRSWFVGGPASVDYSTARQIQHTSLDGFTSQLRTVWKNVGVVCRPEARLVMRFGAIHDRMVEPLSLAMKSLEDTGWVVSGHESAGSADCGRRQALHFAGRPKRALDEYDIWATWNG